MHVPIQFVEAEPRCVYDIAEIIPAQFRAEDWVYKFDGVADEITSVSVGPPRIGELYLYGSVCKPHDCANNNFAFLVEQHGSRAVALIVSETNASGKTTTMLGSPTQIELILLRAKISQW